MLLLQLEPYYVVGKFLVETERNVNLIVAQMGRYASEIVFNDSGFWNHGLRPCPAFSTQFFAKAFFFDLVGFSLSTF